MKGVRNLIILGLIGWFVWSAVFTSAPGERPPIVIRNGPVRIEVQAEGRGPGEFKQGLMGFGRTWYHNHPSQGPSHFDVVVTDSSCGSEAHYDATEMTVTAGGGGGSSSVTVSVFGAGPFRKLQIDPFSGTKIVHDTLLSPNQLNMGAGDDQLQTVRLAGSSCAFLPGAGSITVNQIR